MPEPQMPRGGCVADGAIGRLGGGAVDPDLLDGPGGGAHPGDDAGALEGGPRRAGAGDQPILVAQHDLAVGAHVDEQGDGLLLGHARAQHAGRDIGAHIGAHAGEAIDGGLGVQVQAQGPSAQRRRLVDGGNIGLQADILRVQPQEEMDHRRVARHGRQDQILRAQTLALQDLVDQAVDRARSPTGCRRSRPPGRLA